MQGQTRTKDDTQLPKIQSQKRISTANDRKKTQEDTALANRPLSNNGRTRSLRNFTIKSVKYESAGNIYNKKIQDINKQSTLVEKEIKNVEDEISFLRQSIGNSKKEPGMSRLNESATSYLSKASTRKITLSDEETVRGELKNLESKIINHRNKIDTHLEKNKAIEQQIDAYRKEISTLKNVNFQLEASFKETSRKYQDQMQLSKKLDTEMSEKTELTQRKKVENMHQKAQMIKQYDVILKTLDKKLNSQKQTQQDEKSNFYLTDVLNVQHSIEPFVRSNQKQNRLVKSGKKLKLNEIRQKLQNYQKQFEELKQKIGSQNLQQITQKFTLEYQNNFHRYNFINEMYKEYQDENQEKFQLLQKKHQLLKELQAEKSTSKIKQIYQYREKILIINKQKQKITKDLQLYNKTALQLKAYLGQYLKSKEIPDKSMTSLYEELNDKSITIILHDIYEKHLKQLGVTFGERNKDKRFTKNNSVLGKESVEDLIEQIKKQSQTLKDNHLLTRSELRKTTIQLKEKKMENLALLSAKFRNKKEEERSRTDFNKKISR